MKKEPTLDIRTLRKQVEGLGVTLCCQGSQWILYGRETEPLGHSIKTERDALEFVLDRARERPNGRAGAFSNCDRSIVDENSESGKEGEDFALERITAAAEERQLSENTPTAYRRTRLTCA